MLAAGRTRWAPGERVRYYRARSGAYVRLPDEEDEAAGVEGPRDYDVDHYRKVLLSSCVARLRKAFAPEDFAWIFRQDGQEGLFDRPASAIAPLWIRCAPR